MNHAIEPDLVIGIGCERGTPSGLLERGIERVLHQHGLSPARVYALVTIDRKRDEQGLLSLATRRRWPLWFYSADELRGAAYAGSELVQAHVATPAVAEPAARLFACTTGLLIHKTVYSETEAGRSMTIAVAKRSMSLHG